METEPVKLRKIQTSRKDYNPEEIYLCFICSEILEHPLQSLCGIRICQKCLPNDLCPSCKITITNDHYFYDKSMQKEITLRRNENKIIESNLYEDSGISTYENTSPLRRIENLFTELEKIKSNLNESIVLSKKCTDSFNNVKIELNETCKNRQSLVCYNCTKQHKSTALWRIDNFRNYRNDKKCILTEPIYIKQSSYKVCLKVYPNGDSEESVNHISLFFVLCKGKYDEILNWPYKSKFCLKMLSQNTDDVKHHSETFIPGNDLKPFQRPINEMNVGSGNPCFLKYNNLVDDYFLDADGTLFIELTVYW